MKKFKTDILIGEIRLKEMERIGIKVHYDILTDKEYIPALKNKLLEECHELTLETSKHKIASEMADILDILQCFKDTFKIEDNLINYFRSENLKQKGSFNAKILSKYIEIEDGNPAMDYYTSRPTKYPEIK